MGEDAAGLAPLRMLFHCDKRAKNLEYLIFTKRAVLDKMITLVFVLRSASALRLAEMLSLGSSFCTEIPNYRFSTFNVFPFCGLSKNLIVSRQLGRD